MSQPILHKYLDFGDRAMSDVTLPSGERIVLSIVPSGFAVHRIHLSGLIPGRRLFLADALDVERLVRGLARGANMLPDRPKAPKQHRDESEMMEFLDAATADLTAMAENGENPGNVAALEGPRPERPLSLFTRLALTAADAADTTRRFERASNTPA